MLWRSPTEWLGCIQRYQRCSVPPLIGTPCRYPEKFSTACRVTAPTDSGGGPPSIAGRESRESPFMQWAFATHRVATHPRRLCRGMVLENCDSTLRWQWCRTLFAHRAGSCVGHRWNGGVSGGCIDGIDVCVYLRTMHGIDVRFLTLTSRLSRFSRWSPSPPLPRFLRPPANTVFGCWADGQ